MMPLNSLREIERVTGLLYPPSFLSGVDEFCALVESEGFRRVFGGTRLLLSAPDVAAVCEVIPDAFLPFMCERQSSWEDVYAFDLESEAPEFRVAVWADHAVVMDWEGFPAFCRWIREQIGKRITDPIS